MTTWNGFGTGDRVAALRNLVTTGTPPQRPRIQTEDFYWDTRTSPRPGLEELEDGPLLDLAARLGVLTEHVRAELGRRNLRAREAAESNERERLYHEKTRRAEAYQDKLKRRAEETAQRAYQDKLKAGWAAFANVLRGAAHAMACRGVLRYSKGHVPTYGIRAQSGEMWLPHGIVNATYMCIRRNYANPMNEGFVVGPLACKRLPPALEAAVGAPF